MEKLDTALYKEIIDKLEKHDEMVKDMIKEIKHLKYEIEELRCKV